MKQIGYHHFYTCMDGPMAKPGACKRSSVMALFYFDCDIKDLFPYINSDASDAQLFDNPDLIRFTFKSKNCVLYPDKCIATPFEDRDDAKKFRHQLMAYLNDLLFRRDTIPPKYKVFKKAPVTQIIKLLPKTNCKVCGFESCIAFAAMVSIQKISPSKCPYLSVPVQEQVTYPILDENGKQTSTVTLTIDSERTLRDQQDTPLNKTISNDDCQDSFGLSKREIEVLSLVGQGHTNPQISNILHISPHTVKSHIVNLFNKIGVSDRTQAAVWAVRHKII